MNRNTHKHWFVIVPLLVLGIASAWLFDGQPLVISLILSLFAIITGMQLSISQVKTFQEKKRLSTLRESLNTETKSVEIILKELIEQLPIGIMFITYEEQIRFVNQAWNDWLGIPGSLKLTDFKSHPGLWSVLNRSLGTEDDAEYMWKLDSIYCQVVIKPIRSENQFIGILVSGSDVSKFKNLEKIQQDFLGDISHELKTPITALIGVGDILSGKGPSLSKEQLLEFYGIINKESARLNRLVDDLLDLTRAGAGILKLTKSLFPLKGLVLETIKNFSNELKEKNLTIEVTIPKDLMVFVDHDRLIQVFSNLFSNAIRYTSVGGITVSATKEEKTILISVKDTGMGISKENLEQIFNRFFRTDEARSRYKGGSGLGLSIVKEIIKSHNGTISVKSVLNQGTEFIIRIPKI